MYVNLHIEQTSMPFEKNNELGAKRIEKEPLDKAVIAFHGRKGQKDALKNVPDWQKRFRDFADQLIKESGQTGSNG